MDKNINIDSGYWPEFGSSEYFLGINDHAAVNRYEKLCIFKTKINLKISAWQIYFL